MKSLLLSGVAALATSGLALADQPITAGVVDVGIGYNFVDTDTDDDDTVSDSGRLVGGGRVNVAVVSNFSVQLDLTGEVNLEDTSSDPDTGFYTGALQGAAHLNWREPGQYLVGLFGAYGETYVKQDNDEQGWAIGPEGQVHFGDTTIYGQAGGYWSSENDSESLTDALFARAVGRYFLAPNSFVSVEGLYGFGESSGNADIDLFGWGLRYTHGFDSSPIAIFAGYNGHYVSSKDPGASKDTATEHVFMVGLTLTFGATSLQHNNTHGATLDVPLDLLRTTGYNVDVAD
jgi:hypothetical protein